MITDPLAQLAIIWLAVFLAIYLARRTRLTPVLFYLFVGAALVNLGILPEETAPLIRGLSDIGIIVIMFALGFEESTSAFLRSVRRSWGIALFGAIAPFVAAYAVAWYFWQDVNVALMCGLAMTATAVSLTMVSLKSEGLAATAAATGIMTSAVLDDIASLALVAVLVPIATGSGELSAAGVILTLGKAALFFLLVSAVAAWVLPDDAPRRVPLLGRIGLRNVLSFAHGEHATLTVLFVALIAGLIGYEFGFHPAVGAYMAGLVLREEYFAIPGGGERNLFAETRKVIDNAAFSWIGPIFFVELGTKIVFDWPVVASVIPEAVTLTVTVFVAQVVSASLAARYTGDFAWPDAVMIGFGMLGRAELAFVVMDIAYVQNAILSTEAFYTLMFTCFCLNIAVPVTIAWWKPYHTGGRVFGSPKARGRGASSPD